MENRILKVMFTKFKNSTNVKTTLPVKWLRELGITSEEREILITYDKDNKKIIIEKK